MTSRDGIVRSSAVVAMGTGVSRATGLLRVAALTYALGRTALSDSYNTANVAPNLIYELLVGGVLSATLIPLFIDARANDDDETPSVLVTFSFVALVVITIGSLLAVHGAEAIYHHIIVSDHARAGKMTHRLVRLRTLVALADLLVPQILFYGLTTIATAALNSRRIFKAPAFAPVVNNLITTALLVVSARIIDSRSSILELRGYHSPTVLLLGLGTTAGVIGMSVVLLGPLRDSLPGLRWHFAPRHRAVRAMARLSGWTVGYVIANQIALGVVVLLANTHGEGTLTAYTTAFIFFQLPHGLFAVSIMTTHMPELTVAATDGNDAAFQHHFLEGARMMMIVILPAAVGLFLLSKPLIAVLLQRGNFHSLDADVTGRTLAAFAVGLPGFSLYLYALRAFYARKDTRTPFVINAIENTLNVVLAIVLVGSGSTGLADAYAIAYLVAAILALIRLHRSIGGFGRADARATAGAAARIAIACAAMGAGVWAVTSNVGANHGGGGVLRLAVGVAVGLVIYLIAIVALRVDGIAELTSRLPGGPRRPSSKVA